MYKNDSILKVKLMRHNLHNQTDHLVEENKIVETDWQRWQISYAVRRREVFQHIIETIKKHLVPLL